MLRIPAFDEADFTIEHENDTTTVTIIPNVASENFLRYCSLLQQEGFTQKESYKTDSRSFAAYQKDCIGVFINAFYSTEELQIVVEEESDYFSYSDTFGISSVTPQLTQVKLTDYGLSYVLRLSDNRFVVIDGGNLVDEEADALYKCLTDQSQFEVPVIAAWIMTHPHSDHFYCFFPFMEHHGKDVIIEKFFYNFPNAEDFVHYPNLAKECKKIPNCTGGDVIKKFLNVVSELSVPVYTAHTGQRYQVGDMLLEFLATMDDSIHCSKNINASSLIFTAKIAGQTILFGGDGSFGDTRLPERYGSELKADILQIPHHGFGCGSDQEQIKGYQFIAPRVCLLPASHSEAYTSFTTYREGTNYLMTRLGVEEIITGKCQRTLQLPYEPQPGSAIELRQQYLEGRDNCGARTWIFTELNAGRIEDYIFSTLNTTYLNAEISVELYFENLQNKTIRNKMIGQRLGLFKINCALSSEMETCSFNLSEFLESKGISKETKFAVRFVSNIPVVISHENHTPAYHSTVV